VRVFVVCGSEDRGGGGIEKSKAKAGRNRRRRRSGGDGADAAADGDAGRHAGVQPLWPERLSRMMWFRI
jgi:hypothetical protein